MLNPENMQEADEEEKMVNKPLKGSRKELHLNLRVIYNISVHIILDYQVQY